jgi:hypothetical protein
MLLTTHRLTVRVARCPVPGRRTVAALATARRAVAAPATVARPGLVGAVPVTRGLRASSATARGLKTGIVGLPNVGKVRVCFWGRLGRRFSHAATAAPKCGH